MIHFTCPSCATKFKAREEHAGKKTKCRCCGTIVQVPGAQEPAIAAPTTAPNPHDKHTQLPDEEKDAKVTTPSQATRQCPYCAEKILAHAKKCKHCGEFLDDADQPRQLHTSAKAAPTTEVTRWEGSPSYLYYVPLFILGTILIAAFGLGREDAVAMRMPACNATAACRGTDRRA